MTKLLIITITSLMMTSWTLKEKDFHVKFEQNGRIIEPVNHEVYLSKKEFKMVFEFSEPMGVLINSSFDNTTFILATKNTPFNKLPGFQNTGMAENLLNKDKEVFVSNNSPSFWFYDSNRENRFNECSKVKDKFICKRIVQNIYNIDNKSNTKVEDISRSLHLVFISYKKSDNKADKIELKREYVKIKWK